MVANDREPDLSVVILSFRTPLDTLRAMRSVADCAGDLAYELIVVDNGSGDGTVETIRRDMPDARLIELECNLGFAAGMNAGIAASRGDVLLLLNSDVVALPGSMQVLVEAVRRDPSIGLAAPSLVDDQGSECRVQLLQPTVLRAFIPLLGRAEHHLWRARTRGGLVDVEATEGAAVAISRRAIEAAGPLDDDFFFYHEIVEWCARIRESGFRVAVVADSRMIHACGGATGGVRRAARVELKRSEYQLMRKRAGRGARTAVVLKDTVAEALNVVFHAALCVATLGLRHRSRDKLTVHASVLAWILTGMPSRKSAIYRKLFGSWD